jgi:hypothetical protein
MVALTEDTGIRQASSGAFVQVPGAAVAFRSRGDGATLRTLYERDQDWVYVTDFMTAEQQADAFAGTLIYDHQPAIQAALDYAIYRDTFADISGGPKVVAPGGVMRIDRPIQVGYGIDVRSVIFEGQGNRFGGNLFRGGSGTTFVATFDDAPAVVVQGGRNVKLRDFSLAGLNQDHVVGILTTPAMTDLVATNWIDPSFPSSASSRYAPYAGIAIDPYSGTQPGVHYPDVNYPAFLGAVSQYGKQFSSATSIENVGIQGFYVGIAQQPCDADGNGDFTHLRDVAVTFCGFGFAWGNSQSRVSSLDGCNITACHTALDASTFGKQTGQPQVEAIHCSFGQLIQIFNIHTLGFGQGPSLQHCFAESLYSIGFVGGNAQELGSVRFENCEFGMSWWGVYGVPLYMLATGAAQTFYEFDSCHWYIGGFVGPTDPVAWGLNFQGSGVGDGGFEHARCYSFTGCTTTWATYPSQLWQKCAFNATGGLTITDGSRLLQDYSWRQSIVYDLDTGGSLGPVLYNQFNSGPRNRCLPAYSQRAKSLKFDNDPGVPALFRFGGISATGAGGVVTQVGRNITFTFTGADTNYLSQFGGDVGDVLISRNTGRVYWVYSRTADTFTARAMCGFDSSGNLLTAEPDGAEFATMHCRHYCVGPNVVMYGDFASGVNDMTNVLQGNSTPVGTISPLIQVGDWIFVDIDVDQFISAFGANRVTAIDNVAKTITFAGPFLFTREFQRIGIFSRPAMPNGTPT